MLNYNIIYICVYHPLIYIMNLQKPWLLGNSLWEDYNLICLGIIYTYIYTNKNIKIKKIEGACVIFPKGYI